MQSYFMLTHLQSERARLLGSSRPTCGWRYTLSTTISLGFIRPCGLRLRWRRGLQIMSRATRKSSYWYEWGRVTVALLIGIGFAAFPAILQPHFKAGSLADLICGVILLPGMLVATPFHDRGTASPEFLWRTWLATVAIFGGLSYWLLRRRNSN
jgi:hypothetical protein